jgi:hypothetical protein
MFSVDDTLKISSNRGMGTQNIAGWWNEFQYAQSCSVQKMARNPFVSFLEGDKTMLINLFKHVTKESRFCRKKILQ